MRLAVLATAALCTIAPFAFAGDDSKLAGRPLSADEIASKYFGKDAAGRTAAEKAIAEASSELLRAVLSSARFMFEKPLPEPVLAPAPVTPPIEVRDDAESPEPPAPPP